METVMQAVYTGVKNLGSHLRILPPPFSNWNVGNLIKATIFNVPVRKNNAQWKCDIPSAVSSAQFSHSVVSDSLRPHESQHTRPPCPSPTPGVQTHVHRVGDAIQPSHPLSSPFPPALNPSQHQSFPMSQLFAWGGQSTGVSAVKCIPISEMLTVKESMLVSYCFSLWRL